MRMPVHSRRVLSSARRGSSSVGRALASQAGGRGFETRLPLNAKALFSKPRTHPGLFFAPTGKHAFSYLRAGNAYT